MFVVVDGIDGSGKGTIANALADRERARGSRVLDVREFAKQEHRLPEPEETAAYDLLLSAEPTHTWIGQAIREEIIRDNGRDYTARQTGEAYALDRLMLYTRVLLPARARGAHIIQERSFTTSIVYQPIQAEAITVAELLAMPGNTFALINAPDLCIIVSTEPARAMQRLALRSDKRDDAIFERLPFLERSHEGFHASWFRDLLTAHGCRVEYLDANGAVEDAVARAHTMWDTISVPTHAHA